MCEWTGCSLAVLALVAFQRIHSPGKEWLAWGALVVLFLLAAVVELWLTRFLLRKFFTLP
jgi:hypothetical protein